MNATIEEKKLGLSCGKFCATCSQPVSLDGQGRYLCYKCGHLVKDVKVKP